MAETTRRRNRLSLVRRGGRQRQRDAASRDRAGAYGDIRSIEYDGVRWVDLRHPTPADVDQLGQEYGLHPLCLEDITSRIQRPKIDVYDDYLFIVMQFPVHHKDTRVNEASEVDVVVGRDFFITIHDGNLRPLARMVDSVFESDTMSIKLLRRTPGYLLYEVVDRLVDFLVPIVPKIEERIERIEDMIFEARALETVQEISLVRRDLISMRRILKPQLVIINRFEVGNLPFLDQEIRDYWGDVSDHLGRTMDSIEEFSEILAGLSDTHDTLISQRMNDIIKTLTIFTAIMLPLTLITGIFGMNVPLPYQDSIWETWLIIGVLLAVMAGMLIFFWRRRWL